MKENTSWKIMDESSVTFQLSISGPGEFGLSKGLKGPYVLCNGKAYMRIYTYM